VRGVNEAIVNSGGRGHGFEVRGGCLHVGGISLTRLAERVGSTPFFAYDRALIKKRVNQLRSALPPGVRISYAVKANPMPAVVQCLSALVDGFDVASAGEMKTALDTAMPVSQISFAGPGKRAPEIAQAIAAGVKLSIESEAELAVAARLAEGQGRPASVVLRVNPDFELKSAGMRMGGGPRPFGIDAERIPELLRNMRLRWLQFEGFHIFAGSQNLRTEALIEAHRMAIDLGLRLAREAPGPMRSLNIGGGLGIPYFSGDTPLDLSAIGDALGRHLPRLADRAPGAEIVVELGRYIVGEAGVYVTRVVDCKQSRGHTFLVTDGGLHHHLAASGNFGQVIRKNYPVAIGNRMEDAPDEPATVVGCLCTPLDVLGDRVPLPHAQIGDLVVVFQSGAYGLTASPTAFLGHPAPVEVLV
jgi:diaminopimelate decarboxylase